jgi:light-regulated signal transduction histidine kinase (bacteriophytochrome)
MTLHASPFSAPSPMPVAPPDAAYKIASDFRDYAYSVSHDLGAPVRAMVEFSRLLNSEHAATLNAEGREYLSLIVESGKKLQKMMDGLLQYSRLNTLARPFSRVNLNHALENCRTILSPRLAETGGAIESTVLPVVDGDNEQIAQLLLVLLANALTYQKSGNVPQIMVSASRQEGFWYIAVADNGIGVPTSFHQRIFQLFQRLHTEEEYPGIGMGLTLAQKIIEHHGGKIWCESVPGTGATFLFSLPAKETSL